MLATLPYKIGQGYDLHRLVEGPRLMLGGVHVPCPLGSEAHSDGDVLLHALIDALLGACGLGDIGDHFPPSDDQYQGVSSTTLLIKILPLIAQAGYQAGNIDVTIFLEKPKLGAYKPQIRENLARLLGLPLDCVSVKAKTAEKFAPIGTQEAIAASVTALLMKI
jgi:2-C-methyl-D-erythritol 2,4-cyclodiphosphate synthase